jgi:hypothetical protein
MSIPSSECVFGGSTINVLVQTISYIHFPKQDQNKTNARHITSSSRGSILRQRDGGVQKLFSGHQVLQPEMSRPKGLLQ